MLEIIGMCVEDAKKIEYCGADRIELVSALTEGGLTPSYALIENVVKSVKIPVNVMIRPHAKNFVYTKEDINIMKKDIQIAKNLGVNGVVFGTLDEFNSIDGDNLKYLLEYCDGIDVTFHRAIDETNLLESISVLNKHKKITNILTSGGKNNISSNIDIINNLIEKSTNINILLGGGLNFDNIEFIKDSVNTKHFHFGTAVRFDKSPFLEIDELKLKKLVDILK